MKELGFLVQLAAAPSTGFFAGYGFHKWVYGWPDWLLIALAIGVGIVTTERLVRISFQDYRRP